MRTFHDFFQIFYSIILFILFIYLFIYLKSVINFYLIYISLPEIQKQVKENAG